MEIKKNISAPKKGMIRDKHPSQLEKQEYTFALNANNNDEHGNGMVVLQNEPSNVKCSDFKEGFVVVGHKYDNSNNKTYFFLNNPSTGCSEIGVIDSTDTPQPIEAIESECGCNLRVELEDPKENTTQTGYCSYTTLLSDCCDEPLESTKCLNFSIDYPIKETNVVVQKDSVGTKLFFTDYNNNQRYVNLDRIESYYLDDPSCEQPTETCLQCEKMRIFPEFKKPTIKAEHLTVGGNLRAGVYEAWIAYCTADGASLSDYYSHTNPIPIFDQNQKTLDKTNLDYLTSFSISLNVEGLDPDFEYYKIVVAYKKQDGINRAVIYKENGVYPIYTEKVKISDIEDKSDLTPEGNDQDQEAVRALITDTPKYTKAKGLAEGNGRLFQYGLESQRVINLQPIVNFLGAFVKWNTVRAKEDLYEYGGNISNYLSFMRDEVYPISIKFYGYGGFETNLFPFIPRPPKEDEVSSIVDSEGNTSDLNAESILKHVQNCNPIDRNKKWQFYNTATIDEEQCSVPAEQNVDTEIITTEQTFNCYLVDTNGDFTPVNIISSGTLEDVSYDGGLVDYINENKDEVLGFDSPTTWSGIQNALDQAYPGQTCDPSPPPYCDTPMTIEEEDIFVIDANIDNIDIMYDEFADYDRVPEAAKCNVLEYEIESGDRLENESFMEDYMGGTLGTTVYKRVNVPSNNICTSASGLPNFTQSGSINSQIFFPNLGGFSESDLQKSKNATDYPTTTAIFSGSGAYYTPKLHTSVQWFELKFSGRDRAVFEMSTAPEPEDNCDDNSGGTLRVSVYEDCNASNNLTQYDTIVDPVITNDPNKFIELQASDFPGGVAYIAIDTEMFPRPGDGTDSQGNTVDAWTLRPPCGCFNVYQRDPSFTRDVVFSNMTFGKEMTYMTQCDFEVPILGDCDPIPYEKGDFSYWESQLKYPCNPELYNSTIKTNGDPFEIEPSDIPSDFRDKFKDYYVDNSTPTTNGFFNLTSEADFQDKNIRHYKFPDSKVTPFITREGESGDPLKEGFIYPIGLNISNEIVNAFLDIAVKNNLMSLQERVKIDSYEIFRGDRRTEKSVIAKGLLFDMYGYDEIGVGSNNTSYYPNYPLNTLGRDLMNGSTPHPYDSSGNNRYTFHSPDTHFYNPTLPPELSIEGYMYGQSVSYFDEVLDHPKYVVLGKKAYASATTLAIAEVSFDIIVQSGSWLINATAGGLFTSAVGAALAAVYIVALVIQAFFKVGALRHQWIKTFRNLGKPEQFAYYQAAVGHYKYFSPNGESSSLLRGVPTRQYLDSGLWNVNSEVGTSSISINNLDREDSVFLYLGNETYNTVYPSGYSKFDNKTESPQTATRTEYFGVGKSPGILNRAASPYAALKQYSPEQYGSINSIEWLNTGFTGDLNDLKECNTIFGGDTYLSRFSVKRKFPYFTTTAFRQADFTPFKYSDYFNVAPDNFLGRYYLDYKLEDSYDNPLASTVFPSNRSEYRFSGGASGNQFYQKPPAKFYLYSYGFPYFLVESEFNGNFRYAENQPGKDFYPHERNVIDFTQERNVPIREPNHYRYNSVYLSSPTRSRYSLMPISYEEDFYNRLNDLSNFVIYSERDASQTDKANPYLIYKPLNSKNYDKEYGDLVDMTPIESEQILGRFTNGFTIFGAIDQIRDRQTPETGGLGTGGIFAGRNVNFNKTKLGYAGTQSTAKISCKYGHFWVDSKRGVVFQLKPNGEGLLEITKGVESWFKEQLPFKIYDYFENLTEIDKDNTYKGIGITMGWDERWGRLFITKLDYTPVEGKGVQYLSGIGFYVGSGDTLETVSLNDTEYFNNCSWTIAYSPKYQHWVSYYSFTPNYYVEFNNFFQTGVNNLLTTDKSSLWSHLPFQSSYQVFYGDLYPFTVEYPQITQYANSVLHDISYWLDVRKYYNKHNYSNMYGSGFNKATVYNPQQNTGLLELKHQDKNNLQQQVEYPKYKGDSVEILQSEVNGKWTFNHLFNIIRDETSGLPLWLYDCANVDKKLNNSLLDYRNKYKDRIRGDYFLVRLTQDAESRFNMLFRLATDTRGMYPA